MSHSGSAVTEEELIGEPIQRRPVRSRLSLHEFPQIVRCVASLTAIPSQSPDEILFRQVPQGVVNIHGAPPIHALCLEVGLKESGPDRVGGPTGNLGPRLVILDSGWSKLGGRVES